MTDTRNYFDHSETTEDTTPLVCPHCSTPTYYDYADEMYHHAARAEHGCFLIPSEQRDDDDEHPLYAAYNTFEKSIVVLTNDQYGAAIFANETGTLFRLHWTDYVCGDWTEHFYSSSQALTRLASLERCRESDFELSFAMDEEQFNGAAAAFLNSTLS